MSNKGPTNIKLTMFPKEVKKFHTALCKVFECDSELAYSIEDKPSPPGTLYCLYAINGTYKPENIKMGASLHYLGHIGKFSVNISLLKDTKDGDEFEWRKLSGATDKSVDKAIKQAMETLNQYLDEFVEEVKCARKN